MMVMRDNIDDGLHWDLAFDDLMERGMLMTLTWFTVESRFPWRACFRHSHCIIQIRMVFTSMHIHHRLFSAFIIRILSLRSIPYSASNNKLLSVYMSQKKH